jgi:hypothetical protein
VKLLAVIHVLIKVYVATKYQLFKNASLIHHVLFCVHGCCALIGIVVVLFRVFPSKLYAAECSPIPISFGFVILSIPFVHSNQELLAKVNVGAVQSYT